MIGMAVTGRLSNPAPPGRTRPLRQPAGSPMAGQAIRRQRQGQQCRTNPQPRRDAPAHRRIRHAGEQQRSRRQHDQHQPDHRRRPIDQDSAHPGPDAEAEAADLPDPPCVPGDRGRQRLTKEERGQIDAQRPHRPDGSVQARHDDGPAPRDQHDLNQRQGEGGGQPARIDRRQPRHQSGGIGPAQQQPEQRSGQGETGGGHPQPAQAVVQGVVTGSVLPGQFFRAMVARTGRWSDARLVRIVRTTS